MSTEHGFTLLEERTIPEINTLARLYKHERTGAELLSLINDDENKSFVVGFQTPPQDDTGLPHILEHSVLCGSRKYPVKDPFVQLLKSSLKTFLNAITFPDMTLYPVASTNLKDFYNLVDVYLDAVFYPLIAPETLMQEGWHYEAESADSPLSFKGVVFNEMKAAYSSPDRLLGEETSRALLPDTPYALSSGGDPAAIPELTYEQFKRFHETYYHPSNARIVFYGDDDPGERLRRIDEFLAEFEAMDVNGALPLQESFSEPRRVEVGYDAGEENQDGNKSLLATTWLLPEITDRQRALELSVLSHALISTPASPLRKALIDSGLGEGLAGSGLSTFQRQMSFGAGLKNIAYDSADEVETLILDTLREVAENGLDKATVEASLNTVEFSLRERNTGGFPRGLMSAIGVLPTWMHGGNPLEALGFEQRLDTLKSRLEGDERYFERMIDEYFLNNPHRVTVLLYPDPAVGEARDKAEKERLEQARASMNAEQLQEVLQTQEKLRELQETPDDPEDLAKIPSLTLDDIEREIKRVPQEITEQDGARLYYHEQPTSGVLYFDVAFDLRVLPAPYLPYVDLFGAALTRMGTDKESFVQLTQRIGSKTGGVGATGWTATLRNEDDYAAYLFVRGKTTSDKTQDLLDIFRDVLLTVNLDNRERFKQIVLERKAQMERSLPMAGHQIANSRIRAQYATADWADEQMAGANGLFFLRELAERVENDWERVANDLKFIRETLVNRSGMLVNVTAEAHQWQTFQPQLTAFLGELPVREAVRQPWERDELPPYEGLTMPLQVSFNAKGAKLSDFGYQRHGSQSVILKHMNMDYLWQHIRVQGGAYGGRATLSANSLVLTFLSWRDPNILGTLKSFDNAAQYLQSVQLSQEDLNNAIIGAIGAIDSYQLPDAKGFSALVRHILGYSDEQRQQFRDEVLSTTLEDFQRFGAVLEQVAQEGRVAVVSSPEALKAVNDELGGKFTLTRLL